MTFLLKSKRGEPPLVVADDDLQDLIGDCRRRREPAVTRAWTRGHVVRLADTLSRIHTSGQ